MWLHFPEVRYVEYELLVPKWLLVVNLENNLTWMGRSISRNSGDVVLALLKWPG